MWKKLNTVLCLSYLAKLVRSTKSELRPFVQELLTELNTLQRQNSQLLSINNSMSQTHAEIGVLLSERRDNEDDFTGALRVLLDKNDAAVAELVTLTAEGKQTYNQSTLVLLSWLTPLLLTLNVFCSYRLLASCFIPLIFCVYCRFISWLGIRRVDTWVLSLNHAAQNNH